MFRYVTATLVAIGLACAAQAENPFLTAPWPETDFSKSAVDLDEIMSGGPPRDGIPALTDPAMVAVNAARGLHPEETVLTVAIGDNVRAYPLRYLLWHEIANDTLGGVPVAVTFCPLCNSAMVFDRRLADGRVLEFGVSGLLRNSDMVMYDRQTFTWWQQATAKAIVGTLTGTELTALPAWMESWAAFRDANPRAQVMAEPTGHRRPYGQNPYVGYERAAKPFLYNGENPPHGIPPLVRVVRVGTRAWPLTRLPDEGGRIEEAGVTIHWAPGMRSALDTADLSQGRDTGMVRVRDAEGRDVAHDVMFAFAFHAFWPDGEWMLGQ